MVVIWNISGQGYRSKDLCTPGGARVVLMDGTSVESAFALLLIKVTKPPYPTNISFYTIAGIDTNLCAMSGTGFRKRGEEYDDETNNQWYDWDRVSGHNRRDFIAENVDPDRVQLNICCRNENLKGHSEGCSLAI